jgi:nicotinate-nucleotide--dimethylbenzimidazole phosphoribosyltransferase
MKLEDIINKIQPLDEAAMQSAQARQNMLTKPQGSMGRLEELSIQLAGIYRQPIPPSKIKLSSRWLGITESSPRA